MTRVCVATAGHLSACPRLVRVADALQGAGYDVHVVSTRSTDWAIEADVQLRQTRTWSWNVVDLSGDSELWRQRWISARHRVASAIAARLDSGALPWRFATAAFSRIGAELREAIVRSRPDVVFAGTSGALAPAHDAARALDCRYGADLDHLYTDERNDAGAALHHRLAHQILSVVLPEAALVTTASHELAVAYRSRYGSEPLVLHNVWPLPAAAPVIARREGPLQFYWFGRTIGQQRGLELSIRGIGAAGIDARLVLRGHVTPECVSTLRDLAAEVAPRLVLEAHPPLAPDQLPESCAPFDIGLTTETGVVQSHELTLSNRLFVYLISGLAVMATTMPAQRSILKELDPHVAWLDPEEPASVATVLQHWSVNREALVAARQASWQAAARRWHWTHPLERGRFLDRFAQVFA